MNSKHNSTTYSRPLPAAWDLFNYLQEKTGERKTRIEAYCDLLDKASARSVVPGIKRQEPAIGSGQCHITISDLSSEWKWHRATVRSFLDHLEELGQIERVKLPKSIIITMPPQPKRAEAEEESPFVEFTAQLTDSLSRWENGRLSAKQAASLCGQLIDEYAEIMSNESDGLCTVMPNVSAQQGVECGLPGESGQPNATLQDILRNSAMTLIAASALRRKLRSLSTGTTLPLEDFFVEDLGSEWSGFFEASRLLVELLVDGRSDTLDSESEATRLQFGELTAPFKSLIGRYTRGNDRL